MREIKQKFVYVVLIALVRISNIQLFYAFNVFFWRELARCNQCGCSRNHV